MTASFRIISIYRDCSLQALRSLTRNWLIIPASVTAYLISGIATGIVGQLGIIGAILAGLLEVLLLAFYYTWLKNCSERNRLNLNNVGVLEPAMFSNTLNVAFVVFLALQTVRIVAHGSQLAQLVPLAQLAVFLILNSLPEVIYVHQESGFEAISRAARFTRDNWIEWYLPLVLLILPWAWGSFEFALVMFAQSDPLLPVLLLVRGTMSIIPGGMGQQMAGLLLIVIVANWFMLFRGHLFQALQSRSSNPRAYK